jgi:hypothetical protein
LPEIWWQHKINREYSGSCVATRFLARCHKLYCDIVKLQVGSLIYNVFTLLAADGVGYVTHFYCIEVDERLEFSI